MINLHPTTCNLCGGKVEYVSNAVIYGKKYGSGKCYRCTSCNAYVGTHVPRPTEAFGILADEKMRSRKVDCHKIFDTMWKNRNERSKMYQWLASKLQIPVSECHFGFFDMDMLNKAYIVLKNAKEEEAKIA